MQTVRSTPLLPLTRTAGPDLDGPENFGRRVLQAAFRVEQFNDIHERAATVHLKLPLGTKRTHRLCQIEKAGALFVHVPKNAGTSICKQLYGGLMMHESARYYRHVAPQMSRVLPSFAIWRDPVERFVSAYAFARKGGTSRVQIHPSVRRRYSDFATLDDALCHIETARSPFALDHVFRPQSWYVCDAHGTLLVDRLYAMDDLATLHERVPALHGVPVPHLNENRNNTIVTDAQRARILAFYEDDVILGHTVTREALRAS